VLWCCTHCTAHERGRLYGPGLADIGLDPCRLIVAEAAKTADVLWTLEEGLKCGALALVVGVLDEVELTPSRRLALAAAETRTPGLLVTHPLTGGAGAALTRWRVGRAPSAPHPFVPRAPGAFRVHLKLERCRHGVARSEVSAQIVEWLDEAYRFRLAPGMADRTDAAGETGRRAQA
jgi:protein ImuA